MTEAHGRPPSAPVPAATVVLARPGPDGPEVLLTKRPASMAFGPNLHVFPGGRVDAADVAPAALAEAGLSEDEAAQRLGLGMAPDGRMTPIAALAHHIAAVRETAEETGIEIAARDLVHLSRWVTPPSMRRRFDVRFFAALLPAGSEVVAGSPEVVETRWLTPAAALASASTGEIELWQPTFVTLQQLDGLADEAAVRAAFAVGPSTGGPEIARIEPHLARVDAVWAAGVPGRRATGWLVGAREVVVVDPADPTGVTADAILAALAETGARPVGVAISDLAPERHAGVEMFAHGLGLPVVAPPGVAGRAPFVVQEVGYADALPFGDSGWPLERVLHPTWRFSA